jgi:hypothetical protein
MENAKNVLATAPKNAEKTLQNLIFEVKFREEKFGYVLDDQLLEIARLVTENRYRISKDLQRDAIIILAKYHMATLAYNRNKIKEYEATPPKARCARCGLPISSKKSLKTGLGAVCRKKAGGN